jgi:hypothetical protein
MLSRDSPAEAGPPIVLIGSPGCRRVELFQEALARLGRPPARLVPYTDLLTGCVALPKVVPPGAVVRIESPGKEFEVERLLLAEGAEAAEAEGCARLSLPEVEALSFERGRLLPSRQWYLGFCRALGRIERELAACLPHRLMNRPADIAAMFDKPGCHARLTRAGVAVPRSLGLVRSYDELIERMRRCCCARVFVKLAHGSSASGVVAYQTNGARHHATTTVEMARQGGELRLYNSRRLQIYQDPREIAALIDALCGHRAHVEEWVPKAGIEGRVFDLRVVVIRGRARHVVARLSRGPMTNLHLLNDRGDPVAGRARMGENAWAAALATCERAMGCFPGSHYAGIDLLIAAGFRRHAVLEVNAFGDLLPGVLRDGLDTYAAELLAMEDGGTSARPGKRTDQHEPAAVAGAP